MVIAVGLMLLLIPLAGWISWWVSQDQRVVAENIGVLALFVGIVVAGYYGINRVFHVNPSLGERFRDAQKEGHLLSAANEEWLRRNPDWREKYK